jgi:hypothetical protein
MVDNDREQFTLWKARATTDSKIVAISAPNCQNQITAAAPSSTSQLNPTSSQSAADAATFHTSVSKGAIAGAVIGGLAVIALFFLGFLFLRKRVWARVQQIEPTGDSGESRRPESSMLHKPELAADRQSPQEMPSVQDPGYTLPPHEMSEGRSNYELPTEEAVALTQELPDATPLRKNFELPALPSSPRQTIAR